MDDNCQKSVDGLAKSAATFDQEAIRDKTRAQINLRIERLLEIGRVFNPIEILAPIACLKLFHDPETFRPASDIGQPQVEHLVSLFLAQPFEAAASKPTPDAIQECFDLLDGLQSDFPIFYLAASKPEDAVRYQMMVHSQFVRGEAYAYHAEKQFLELAPRHDTFLQKTCGFGAAEFFAAIRHAGGQLNEAINNRYQLLREAKGVLLMKYTANLGTSTKAETELLEQALNDSAFIQAHSQEVNQFTRLINFDCGSELFQVRPRDEMDAKIYAHLTAQFGQNREFLDVPNWRGWPLNTSITSSKPFLFHEGNYYLFLGPQALRDSYDLLERLIEEKNSDYFRGVFLRERDTYLEATTFSLLNQLLPGASGYAGLFYSFIEDGQSRRAEVDAVFVFGEALFIVECKAGKFSSEARRGAPLRLKRDLRRLLDEAFQQGTRLANQLRLSETLVLTDESGREVVRLRHEDFKYQFILSVTFDQVSLLQSNLNVVRGLGLIQGKEWPWSVSLNDLRVFSDIIGHPSTFIHYLLRRIEANEYEQLNVADELELLGYYLAGQLYFGEGFPHGATRVVLTGYTEEIDSYYWGLSGVKPKTEKPKQKLPPMFEAILCTLEAKRPRYFVTGCIDLLQTSGETRFSIDAAISLLETQFINSQRPQAVALWFERENLLLVIGCSFSGGTPSLDRFPACKEIIEAKKTSKITAIFWCPPLRQNTITVNVCRNE